MKKVEEKEQEAGGALGVGPIKVERTDTQWSNGPVVRSPAARAAPVTKSQTVIDLILESVSAGTPLAEVCRQEWAPHPSTWYDWLNDDPALDRRFARARELGQAAIEAHSRLVARGEKGYSSGDVKRDRLIVDTYNRMIDRWDRRYANGTEPTDQAQLGNLVDPRSGFYFSSPDAAMEFVIFTIFACTEERKGVKEGHFTALLKRDGFPDLATCEAVVSGERFKPTCTARALPSDARDLA